MWTTIESPIGELRLVGNGRALTAVEFSPFPQGDGRPRGERSDDDPVLRQAATELGEYFDRQRTTFTVAVDPSGTDFQRRVWKALLGVGYGETASYGQIAAALGKTNAASRAVGTANGSNPIPVIIPCHRIIGANGTLTGYAGGVDRKQVLLDLEQHSLF